MTLLGGASAGDGVGWKLGTVGSAGIGSRPEAAVRLSSGGSAFSGDTSVLLASAAVCGCDTGATGIGAGDGLGSNRTCTTELCSRLADPAGGCNRIQ